MNQKVLIQRRERMHALVEGALLTDIAIVFLLMRAYLPVLIVRPTLLAMATVPIVVLLYRRGVKTTILACIAAYILFSALVGPFLALAVMHITIAGVLLGLGRKAGLPMWLNLLWSGPVFALLDVVLPTVLSVIVFRYPVHDLVQSAKNFIRLMLNFTEFVLKGLQAPSSVVHDVQGWEQPLVTHWQFPWLGAAVVFGGYGTLLLVALVVDIVLRGVPEYALARQGKMQGGEVAAQ